MQRAFVCKSATMKFFAKKAPPAQAAPPAAEPVTPVAAPVVVAAPPPRPGHVALADLVIGDRIVGAVLTDNTHFGAKYRGTAVAIKIVERARMTPLLRNAERYW